MRDEGALVDRLGFILVSDECGDGFAIGVGDVGLLESFPLVGELPAVVLDVLEIRHITGLVAWTTKGWTVIQEGLLTSHIFVSER